MSWLSKAFRKIDKEVFDDALGIDDPKLRVLAALPVGGVGLGMALSGAAKSSSGGGLSLPKMIGPTDADVQAADLRLRRQLGRQNRGGTNVTGGLAGQPARLTMPTLIGV